MIWLHRLGGLPHSAAFTWRKLTQPKRVTRTGWPGKPPWWGTPPNKWTRSRKKKRLYGQIGYPTRAVLRSPHFHVSRSLGVLCNLDETMGQLPLRRTSWAMYSRVFTAWLQQAKYYLVKIIQNYLQDCRIRAWWTVVIESAKFDFETPKWVCFA